MPKTKKEDQIEYLKAKIKHYQDLRLLLQNQLKYIFKAMDKAVKYSQLDLNKEKEANQIIKNSLNMAKEKNRDLNKNLGIRVNVWKEKLRQLQKS